MLTMVGDPRLARQGKPGRKPSPPLPLHWATDFHNLDGSQDTHAAEH